MGLGHLSKRFFGSVSAKDLTEEELQWVKSNLLDTEYVLWEKYRVADRRHTYTVARRTDELLGDNSSRAAIAAALLHDIGKTAIEIGTFERVLATLAGSQASQEQRLSWSNEDGWLGRAGTYLMHAELGARMLEEAGSDPITVAWAREHELLHTEWTVAPEISDALWRADNGR